MLLCDLCRFQHKPYSHGVEFFGTPPSFTAHQPGLPGIRYSFLLVINFILLLKSVPFPEHLSAFSV
nr:MAG TPA: hypothetical protein [Caudoviricetes sp.]